MKILVDSNVLLIGALNPFSNAHDLRGIATQAQFVVPGSVVAECHDVIDRRAPSEGIGDAAKSLLDQFMSLLNCLHLPSPPSGEGHDQHVIAAADEYECELICTYNVRDFESSIATALPPLAVLREFDFFTNAIEYPILGEEGTLLIRTRQHEGQQIGRILRTSNGTEVVSGSDRMLTASGPDVHRCDVHSATPASAGVSFVFRYRADGYFEASTWTLDYRVDTSKSAQPTKTVLTSGEARFEPPVTPLLFFGANYGFGGELTGISGTSHYVRDKHLGVALATGTLEPMRDSEDVVSLLGNVELVQNPPGPDWIALRATNKRTRRATS